MIDIQPFEKKLETLKIKMNWLIDGYFINCLLPSIKGRFSIPDEWIIKHYNTDLKLKN